MRTRLAHGSAQGTNTSIYIPPGRIVGQGIEIHQGIFQARLRRQRITGNCYYLGNPAVRKRLAQD